MLAAYVLNLLAERDADLPPLLGRANYAQVLAQISLVDAPLAAAVHDKEGLKPLACSGLLDANPLERRHSVRKGQRLRVRVSATDPTLSRCLHRCLVEQCPSHWELDRHAYAVEGVACSAQDDTWAGISSCQEIARRHMLDGSNLPPTVTLKFASPLSFKSAKGLNVALPLPSLVFGSLADRWNSVSSAVFREEMRAFADEYIGISCYDLRSVPVPQTNGALRIGCVGTVTYRALDGDRYWLGAMQALAEFAFYSGVGVQTATGMGQVCRVGVSGSGAAKGVAARQGGRSSR